MAENYRRSLERVVDAAEEIVLTAHRSFSGTLVDEALMDRLQRVLIESRRLRQRLDDGLVGADDDVDTETLRERLKRSQ